MAGMSSSVTETVIAQCWFVILVGGQQVAHERVKVVQCVCSVWPKNRRLLLQLQLLDGTQGDGVNLIGVTTAPSLLRFLHHRAGINANASLILSGQLHAMQEVHYPAEETAEVTCGPAMSRKHHHVFSAQLLC